MVPHSQALLQDCRRLQLPVKHTFVHFPEQGAGQAVTTRRRVRSLPAGRSSPWIDDAAQVERPVARAASDGARPAPRYCALAAVAGDDRCDAKTMGAREPSVTTVGESQSARSTTPSHSDAESGDGDLTPRAAHNESMAVSPPDAAGRTRVSWRVEAGRVTGQEHKVASPVFLLPIPGWGWGSFQLFLFAHNKRKVLTFGQANGCGRVELKCLDQLPPLRKKLSYSMKIGTEDSLWIQHDFSRAAQQSQRRLDLAGLADPCTGTLDVELCFTAFAGALQR